MGKTLFVTGGSRGIGEAIVKMAAGRYNVAFTYNANEERALELARRLNGEYGGVIALKCDLADPNSVAAAVEEAKKRFFHLDFVVNNAGIASSGLFVDTPQSEVKRLFEVDVFGMMELTRLALKDMLGRGGAIVNISSKWGEVGASMEVAYSSAKAAVIGFTKALAKEVAPMGVRVNAIAPGAIDTDMMKAYSDEDVRLLIGNGIPLGRLGRPEEVASAALFLLENEYISGQVLGVDGLLS